MAGICSGANFPDCTTDTLSPDPDIAGIGVILSFIIVNGITIIVTSISILFIHLETLELGGFDLAIHKLLKHLGMKPVSSFLSEDEIKFWLDTLEKILLGLSDTQLLTGIAILIAGYLKCSISVYHSTIIADLAWFASGTHLSSLSILKHYLMKYPITMGLRIFLLLLMVGLFLSLTLYQGHRNWYDSAATPAQCLFTDALEMVGGRPSLFPQYGSKSVFVVRIYDKVVHWTSCAIKSLWKTILGQTADDTWIPGKAQIALSLLGIGPLVIVWAILQFFYQMIDSYFINFIFDIFWWVFGFVSLLSDRNNGQSNMEEEDKPVENQWGFGQVIPMLLILLPMMTAWEVWYEAYIDSKSDKAQQQHSARASPDLSTESSRNKAEDDTARDKEENGATIEMLVQNLQPPPKAHVHSSWEAPETREVPETPTVSSPVNTPAANNELQSGPDSPLVSRVDSAAVAIDMTRLGSTATQNDEPIQRVSPRSTFKSAEDGSTSI